jgi:alpha-beta hydrolase superfamily lysophospholipase
MIKRGRQSASLLAALSFAAHTGDAQSASSWKNEQVQIERAPGIIAGTLTLPAESERVPLVLILAGSGAADRDGNDPSTARLPSYLRQLAESLATHGIASIRYDKRGQFGSASALLKDQLFDTLATDAAAWVRRYRGDNRFNRIIVLGHSEGALVGLLAMLQANADAYVSLEGPARRQDLVLRDHLVAGQLSPSLLALSDTIMAALVAGRTYAPVPQELAGLFRPAVQPYLTSLYRYSAAEEIRKLKVPCLIVHGSSDFQEAPAETVLLKAANPACEVLEVEGMNHVLKKTPSGRAEQMASYYDPSLPLTPGLVEGVVAFVQKVVARR